MWPVGVCIIFLCVGENVGFPEENLNPQYRQGELVALVVVSTNTIYFNKSKSVIRRSADKSRI